MKAAASHPLDPLERQALVWEHAYLTIIAAMYAVLVLVTALLPAAAYEAFPFGPIATCMAGCAVMVFLRHRVGQALAGGAPVPTATILVGATFEVLVGMFTVWTDVAHFDVPVAALYGPTAVGCTLVIGASAVRMRPWLSLYLAGTLAVLYTATVFVLIGRSQGMIDPAFLDPTPHLVRVGMMLIAGGVAAMLTRGLRRALQQSLHDAAERARVLHTFGQYVSPEVADALLTQEQAGRVQERHIAVLFLDIRGFTTLSENREPREVVALLDQLFAFMIEDINAHGGVINKFLGDGFMAIFGAPLDAEFPERDAVAAAEAIIAHMAGREVSVGIGIHAGTCVCGTIGGEGRKEYTVIGDVVNVASRIESANKELDSVLLVSDVVWQELGREGGATVHEGVKVKGREEALSLYALA